jgi:predicted TIM-barrel fold metal-dependent hydrolase
MGFIDSDSHVLECEDTWDCIDPSEREYRPITLEYPGATGPGAESRRQYYVIGGVMSRRFPPESQTWGYGKTYTADVSFMKNPSARLREMDETGVDAQVIFSTLFLTVGVAHPAAEAAVSRAYNRWIAERTAGSGGRLRWVAVAPTLIMDRAIEEMEFGAKNGAVGVMLKASGEHGRSMADPYFHRLYAAAQDLNLTVCMHAGAKRTHFEGLPYPLDLNYRSPTGGTNANIDCFGQVLGANLHKTFPRLRFAFLELGAMWVPAIFTKTQRNLSLISDGRSPAPTGWVETPRGVAAVITPLDPAAMMEERNMYVACFTDEPLPFLTSFLGPDHLLLGTDMCHNDAGTDPLGHLTMMERTDIDQAVARKICDENGRRAYAIPKDFTPAGVTGARAVRPPVSA